MVKKIVLSVIVTVLIVCMSSCGAENANSNTLTQEEISHSDAISEQNITGILSVQCNPAGADIYINGERYEKQATPCLISLEEGNYEIELVIPGYEAFVQTTDVKAGEVTEITCSILPEIPETENMRSVVVTTESDTDPNTYADITVEDLSSMESISLRQALAAIQNDKSDCWYRVEFAENVDHIELVDHIIEFSRDNLVFNGDKNRDGIPDVSITQTEWSLLFRPMNNLHIMGFILGNENDNNGCAIAVRPDDYFSGDVSYSNVYWLGCQFNNCEIIPFCGACKIYDSYGKVDYYNINACGNTLYNSNLFFSYCGNVDDSITDGMYFCANTLDDSSCITPQNSDCNTNYVYGSGTFEANGGIPGAVEACDNNVVRNILVSGNCGGRLVCASSVNGHSNCKTEDIVIRNNIITDYVFIRVTQPIDERNEGYTIAMNNNSIDHLIFEYNVLIDKPMYIGLASFDDSDDSTSYIIEDNVMSASVFRNNYYVGNEYQHTEYISKEIDLELRGGIIPGDIYISNQEGKASNVIFENNRYENLIFENNHVISNWINGGEWDAMEITE